MTNTFERVKEWNKKANKLPAKAGTKDYWVSIENQFKRIEEELGELYEAIKERDILGIVDAGADLDVVVSGLNYLSGSDYASVITTVLDNNDLKITDKESTANNWKAYNEDNGTKCNVVKSNEGFYTVQREEDDKILKYGNFPKVDLSSFIPLVENEHFLLVEDASNIKDSSKTLLENEKYIKVLSLEDEPNEDTRVMFSKILEENGDVILIVNNTKVIDILKTKE